MITIRFTDTEYYNEETNEFINLESKTVDFEYSLLAVAKWEAKYKLPFLNTRLDTLDAKLIDFYLFMSNDPTLTEDYINESTATLLSRYISDSQTATTFHSQNDDKSKSSKIYTSEELYALMFMNGVPLEFENRNLNRLLTTLRIISAYNAPPKKMSKEDILRQNRELNAQRRKQYNTRG